MMKLTLIGTGDVRQIPVFGCLCPACERARLQPEFRRKPCSALLQTADACFLIDGGLTDLCERFQPGQLSGILLTHYHMDHIQGLFHLRWGLNDDIPIFGPDDGGAGSDLKKHPGILSFQPELQAFESFSPTSGLRVTPLPMQHSKPTFGYLFEYGSQRIAYLTDTVGLPAETEAFLLAHPADTIVLDTSLPPQPEPPRNHNDLNLSLSIFRRLTPSNMVLTHIGHEMDHWLMENAMPVTEEERKRIHLACDGMELS